MNIFILSNDPVKAAQLHCNKHVLKMTIEYAQLLSTAHRIIDGTPFLPESSRKIKQWKHNDPILDEILYKATHYNHPCSIWVRSSKSNYEFLYEMWSELCKEFFRRYNKRHLSERKLIHILASTPQNMDSIGLTDFVQCMDKKYHNPSAVIAYNDFYQNEKKFAEYYSLIR